MNDQLACFMSGGLAGSLLWTLGMPGDTMKSKWQTDTGKSPTTVVEQRLTTTR